MMQDDLDGAYVSWQCAAFKIGNASVHHILLHIFMDMDAYFYVKQRKNTKDS